MPLIPSSSYLPPTQTELDLAPLPPRNPVADAAVAKPAPETAKVPPDWLDLSTGAGMFMGHLPIFLAPAELTQVHEVIRKSIALQLRTLATQIEEDKAVGPDKPAS